MLILRVKFIIIHILLILSCFIGFAQSNGFSDLYNEANTYVRNHSPTEGLDYIDILLKNEKSILARQTLNTVKLFPMLSAEMYDIIIVNSSKLLTDSQLPKNLRIVIHLRRALVYEITELFDKSKLELDRASEILGDSSFHKSELKAELLYRYGSLYRIQDMDTIAENYINQALSFSKANNHYDALAVSYMLKGFFTNADYQKQTDYYYKALHHYKSHHDSLGTSAMYFNLSKLNFKLKDYQSALHYTDSIMVYAKPFPYFFAYNEAYQLRASIFKAENKLDSALINFETYHKLFQETNLDKQALNVRALEYQFEIEKEEIDKAQLEINNKKINDFNTKLKWAIYSLVIVLIAFIISVILLKKRNQVVKLAKKNINTKNKALQVSIKEKELLLKELNHRVKNNLSLVLSLINFQKQEIEDEFYKSKFVSLQQRIEAISIVHEQMMHFKSGRDLEDAQNLNDYIQKIAKSLIRLDRRTVNFRSQIPEIFVTMDVAVPIGILINELIANSLKHAKVQNNLLISITIAEANNKLHIDYLDNGKAFEVDNKKSSLGLLIIDSMIKQLKGTYNREITSYHIQINKYKHSD
ncbi:sensor histidine kinase [Winogradskyella bathintestinalis]|uniref:histidine kinase n=1 Tax=Winogradskyella bathintestinalis TaxID=3035208 RepID=A0ABT7ZS24_9FLAO|nr:sensor histidine kinase [Winogradskyella bathintestinalis]MDN3491543.1 sensor histidine kinase [Winogradskyella bathintestinalis]